MAASTTRNTLPQSASEPLLFALAASDEESESSSSAHSLPPAWSRKSKETATRRTKRLPSTLRRKTRQTLFMLLLPVFLLCLVSVATIVQLHSSFDFGPDDVIGARSPQRQLRRRGLLSDDSMEDLPKLSVVLMNYSRPRMIRESSLLPTLIQHPLVDEILLLHASPSTAFEYEHPKVKNIDATHENSEIGLSLRFFFCQIANNDWVLHVDDDIEFAPNALTEMVLEFSKNTHRIVGRFGRDLDESSPFLGYSSRNTHGPTEVVLTKFMVMERATCSAFFEYAQLLWDDVILEGDGPLWNGEDIFMSLVANHVYQPDPTVTRNNYAMDWLDVWHAPDSLKDYSGGVLDISGGLEGYRFWDYRWWQTLMRRNRHYCYRGKLWLSARNRLGMLSSESSVA